MSKWQLQDAKARFSELIDETLLSWFNTLRPEQMAVSAVVLGVLQAGVETTRLQDAQKAQEIEEWIDRVCPRTASYRWMDHASVSMHASSTASRTLSGKTR